MYSHKYSAGSRREYMSEDGDKSGSLEFSSIVNNHTGSLHASLGVNTISGPPLLPRHLPTTPSNPSPPTRPSSTPFSTSEYDKGRYHHLTPAEMPASNMIAWFRVQRESAPPSPIENSQRPHAYFMDLPVEIHIMIINYLINDKLTDRSYGENTPPSVFVMGPHNPKFVFGSFLTELTLVCPTWRVLIQPKLFKHIKVKATNNRLCTANDFYLSHPHLIQYVQDVELWFPVFITSKSWESSYPRMPDMYSEYNCSLLEAFEFMASVFPQVKTLRLEGGDRQKSPKVSTGIQMLKTLPILEHVTNLVTRGQWNLIRDEEDVDFLMTVLPRLTTWHMSYSKQKSKTYITMAKYVLPRISHHMLQNLNLRMECDYMRERVMPPFYLKAISKTHICPPLAKTACAMRYFVYTGRICSGFAQELQEIGEQKRLRRESSSLQIIDITLKNICRGHETVDIGSSGTGVFNMGFLILFEDFVVDMIKSLRLHLQLTYIRIRYLDLNSQFPALNPIFVYNNDVCSGLFSERIVEAMSISRPSAKFPYIEDLDFPVNYDEVTNTWIMKSVLGSGRMRGFNMDFYPIIHQMIPQFIENNIL